MGEKENRRKMRKTFFCDDSMIITIPIGSLKDIREGQLMPEKFHCVFRDSFKVFVVNGKPGPLGAAQAMTGVFLVTLGLVFLDFSAVVCTLPNATFVVSGMLTYAAGKYPNMHVAKLSFSLNIICFFWSVVGFFLCLFYCDRESSESLQKHIGKLIMSLLVMENLIALFLIYWLSRAVCRQHFNSLPTILLKLDE